MTSIRSTTGSAPRRGYRWRREVRGDGYRRLAHGGRRRSVSYKQIVRVMASMRRRTWANGAKEAWIVDYFDHRGVRRQETYPDEELATQRLAEVRAGNQAYRRRLPRRRNRARGLAADEAIYVIAAPDRVKVGVSTEPESRVRALDAGGAWAGTLRLFWWERLNPGIARRIEAAMKTKHASDRILGEWYRLSPVAAVEAVKSIREGAA